MSTNRKITTPDFFAVNPVFSLEEAAGQLGVPRGRTGTVDRLKHYLKTGRLVLVTRGVYAVVEQGRTVDGFNPDPFLVAVAMRNDAIFSYHSALELLGVAHSVWNQVTLYTGKRRRTHVARAGSIEFLSDPDALRCSDDRFFGTQKIERRGRLLTVTGPERTLVEGFRRVAYAGGFEEFIVSAGGFPVLDLDLLNEILNRYDAANLWAATGWFLERFRHMFHVENSRLDAIENKRPRSPRYLLRDQRGGVLVSRWNLILPEGLAKGNGNDEP
jgi:predicted transcriptional regulator of viral defense system